MEKRESFYTVGGNVSWFSHYGKQYGGSSENWRQNHHDPAIPLLGINLDKTISQKDNMHPYVHSNSVHNSQDTETN